MDIYSFNLRLVLSLNLITSNMKFSIGSACMIVLLSVGVLRCRPGRGRARQRAWLPWPHFPPPGAQSQPGFMILVREPVAMSHPQPTGNVSELVWHSEFMLMDTRGPPLALGP